MNSKLVIVVIIAFVQGSMDLYQLPLFYYYKNELLISIQTLTLIQGLIMIP